MRGISVIIPTYNPGEYLFDCLGSLKSSIINNTFIEIIIVLNGDIDSYLNKIENFVSTNNMENVSILTTHIKGVSNARNLGMHNSKMDYLLFVDDDDFVSQGFFKELFAKLNVANSEYDLFVCKFLSYNEVLSTISNDYVTETYNKLLQDENFNLIKYRGFLSSVCGKLISKKIIGNVNFDVHTKISEDGLFMFEISSRIINIKLCKDSAIYYRRIRYGSAMRSDRNSYQKFKLWIVSIINYSKVYLKKPWDYNFLFFLTRILAVTKVYLISLRKKWN